MDLRAIGMGLAFALMWSSAFTSARVIVEYAPPMSALALRFLVSGLLGVGIAWALGQSARLTKSQWRAVVIFGICQNALYLGLNFVAMKTVEASLAAIIAEQQSATSFGSAIRQAPNRPDCTRSDGQPTFRLYSA